MLRTIVTTAVPLLIVVFSTWSFTWVRRPDVAQRVQTWSPGRALAWTVGLGVACLDLFLTAARWHRRVPWVSALAVLAMLLLGSLLMAILALRHGSASDHVRLRRPPRVP